MKLCYFLGVMMMKNYVLNSNYEPIINLKETESLKKVFCYLQFLQYLTRTKILKCEKINYWTMLFIH